jgi:hypothetical protein
MPTTILTQMNTMISAVVTVGSGSGYLGKLTLMNDEDDSTVD